MAQSSSVSSVTTTSSVTTATTGTSVVVTTTATASGGDVSNTQLQLVKVSGNGSGSCTGSSDLSVSDPGSPYTYTTTVSTSGTTKSFTFTVGNCGVYTYRVTATWSGGSRSSSDATVEFIDPTSMTVTARPSTAQANLTQIFNLSIDIQNSQSSNITTSYSLNTSGGIIRNSGDDESSTGITIIAGTTQTLSWVLKHNSCFTSTKTVTFDLGDKASATTMTVTGNSSCATGSSSSSTSTSSGGGGGGSTSTQVKAIVAKQAAPNTIKATFSAIAKDKEAVVEVPSDVDTGLTKILFTAAKALTSAQITVAKLDSAPASISAPVSAEPSVKVYKYIEISHNIAEPEIAAATIQFDIDKSWLDANNIDPAKVVLNRYSSDKWTKLITSKTAESSTKVSYSAATPGFSVFAISGEEKGAAAATGGEGQQTTEGGPSGGTPEQPAATTQTPLGAVDTSLLIGVVILIVIIAAGLVMMRKKSSRSGRQSGYYVARKK
ncbi:MAG: PGF-pre-PGF domain-containing protein [Candidatus Aenigmarchaeota archaeon]|nr:PGF-pre-PGF domain-containing protein [Candidatus Aenigmarchaeota archaeon]